MPENVNDSREIELVDIGIRAFEKRGVRGHEFAKVVEDQAREDLLRDELRPF